MKRYLVDTDCLISYLTDRDISQRDRISPFFELASRSKCTIVALGNVFVECIYVLLKVYGVNPRVVRDIARALLHTPGITLDLTIDFEEILSFWPDVIRDFGDAVIASYAHRKRIPVLTFDIDFFKELNDSGIETEKIP